MKVCLNQFPEGSYPRQQGPGYYMDRLLVQNLEIMSQAIVKDLFFTIIVTGKGLIRVGKSALAQQIATYLNYDSNEKHGFNNVFDINKIHFQARPMMEQALADPIASTHVLDEGDDLTTNFWSDLAQELRRFFRKCGQLNQFLILILPDFFELPTPFALNYSQCLINVHFKGAFERGYYDFYGPERKKNLYLMGKKMKDYSCVAPDFSGDFINLYTVGEEAYRKKKKEDLQNDQAKDTTSPIASTYKRRVALQILERVEKGIVENLKPLQKTQLLDVCVSTVKEYNRELRLNDYFGIEKYQNAGELEPKGLTIAQYPLKKSILPDGNGARMEENEINVS